MHPIEPTIRVRLRDLVRTVVERAERDPVFAKALLREAASLRSCEPELARVIIGCLPAVQATGLETYP